ncbi:unnamed protein product [Linum trigynum]|uniref:Retrotransposon Copia-like N-terminal domain-containing protein n=1 Tax=Linum trigynum TaxID=586398 RepID=A0AAV2FZ87_9ROSI
MAENQAQIDPEQQPPLPQPIDPLSDPFFLHGSEQPGCLLVAEKFTATNYNDWSRAMFNALAAKNKLGFINGTILEPAITDPRHGAWVRNNVMILSWIQQSSSAEIRNTILSSKIALEAWKSLQTRYGSGDLIRIAELEEALASLQQGNQTITDYYGRFITLKDELENYQPLLPCSCTPTSHLDCAAMTKVFEYQETSYVIKFLRGLNENFSGVRAQVLFGDELPNINRVFQRMLQHERQISLQYDVSALAIQGANRRGFSKPPYCTFCKREGHTEDICFQKHGWPPGMSRPSSSPTAPPTICNYCKRRGHTEDKCFQKNGYPANFVPRNQSYAFPRPRPAAHSVQTTSAPDDVKLSRSEYDKLMALVQSQKVSSYLFWCCLYTTIRYQFCIFFTKTCQG